MADSNEAGFICRVCGEPITASGGGVQCRACSTLHHRACWEYARKCSVYACGETRFVVCGVDEMQGERLLLPAVTEPEPFLPARLPARASGFLPALPLDLIPLAMLRGTYYCPECHAVNPGSAPSCAFCDFPVAKTELLDPSMAPRRSRPPVPAPVVVVRSLDRIASACLGLFGMLMLLEGSAGTLAHGCHLTCAGGPPQLLLTYIAFGPALIGLAFLVQLVGSFYELGQGWARRAQLPVSLMLLVFFPFGTILGLASLLFWFAPSASRYFEEEELSRARLLLPGASS